MENTNNSDQQPVDQQTGGPLEGLSPRNNAGQEELAKDASGDPEDSAIYAGLGLNSGSTDEWNQTADEAADTILYTDTATAQHAVDNVTNDVDYDKLPTDEALSEEEIDRLSDETDTTDKGDSYLAY